MIAWAQSSLTNDRVNEPAQNFTVASSLGDRPLARSLARSLSLDDDRLWAAVTKSDEKIDTLAGAAVSSRLVEHDLAVAGAHHDIVAARRPKKMHRPAAGSADARRGDDCIKELSETRRRRARVQRESERAGPLHIAT